MRMYLHHLMELLWNFCFPPSRDRLLVDDLTLSPLSSLYQPSHKDGVWQISVFSDRHIRALVHEAKFKGNKKAYRILGEILRIFINEHPHLQTAVWIPIPLSPQRLRSRGYNQVTEVLQATSLHFRLDICTDVLVRSRDTLPQTDLVRADRLTNMENAFSVTSPSRITGRHVVILDDVVTTGATLRAAQEALFPHHPISITLVALSH